MQQLEDIILSKIRATTIRGSESVQTLWSDYGEIRRYYLEGDPSSVIVKHIQLPEINDHPYGWNTNLSHQRKVKSYQVERKFYQDYAKHTDSLSRVPSCYHIAEEASELLLIMEDLDDVGYNIRIHHNDVTLDQAKSCLRWLARFHARFIGVEPEGLWSTGTYWHLDTRPDELERMKNNSLKLAAKEIDEVLSSAKYQTIVHGDAKLANFCFSNANDVAAVDFQYVGKGCGMKDVAYFISSCFEEENCEYLALELLNYYFDQLKIGLDKSVDYHDVKNEWSMLYKYAWADFYRFLDGWSPGHWKMHSYSKRLTEEVMSDLKII